VPIFGTHLNQPFMWPSYCGLLVTVTFWCHSSICENNGRNECLSAICFHIKCCNPSRNLIFELRLRVDVWNLLDWWEPTFPWCNMPTNSPTDVVCHYAITSYSSVQSARVRCCWTMWSNQLMRHSAQNLIRGGAWNHTVMMVSLRLRHEVCSLEITCTP
jgi:hypothetical protein